MVNIANFTKTRKNNIFINNTALEINGESIKKRVYMHSNYAGNDE